MSKDYSDLTYLGLIDTDEGPVYFKHDETHIYCFSPTNTTELIIDTHELDDCFSMDENLQDFTQTMYANGTIKELTV